MHESKLITTDQSFYDNEPLSSLEKHSKWMHEIEYYFNAYANRFNSDLMGSNGFVVELGAGSCGLSVCLTRLPNVKQVTSLDISAKRMSKMIARSASVLGGTKSKITPVICDFNGPLPFSDGELDAILFDAALHHARSMWNTLAECNRVLRDGGLLIAQRESYLSAFRAKSQLNKLLRTPEIAAKVSENIYLKEQYLYYLTTAGFDVEFIGVERGWVKKLLSVFNGGRLFTDGVLICKKPVRE